MKVAICTYYNAGYEEICNLTNRNKREYAKRHGYTFLTHFDGSGEQQAIVARYRWYEELLAGNRWGIFMFCDGDLIVTNMHQKIEDLISLDDDIVMAKDALMIQAGVMLVRATAPAIHFISRLAPPFIRSYPSNSNDQFEIEKLMAREEFKNVVRVVPQRTLQSYDYALYKDLGGNYVHGNDADGNDGQWKQGDFCLHVPGVADKKFAVLLGHLPFVVK